MSGKKRRTSAPTPPPAKKLKLTVTPELAAEQYGFKLIRSLDRKWLQSETIACLNSHNYDPLQKDPRAKEIIRSGSISSKCQLVRSDEGARSLFKVVAKNPIFKNECVAVYMGSLIEADRCHTSNIWQYNIPSTLFPKKKKIPSLVLDGSKAANETRFFHDAEWYKKSPNITHFIVWDNERRVPQVIYRATCYIDAGQDLLLKWGVPQDPPGNQSGINNININNTNSNHNANANHTSHDDEILCKKDEAKRRKQETEKKLRQDEQISRQKQAKEEVQRQQVQSLSEQLRLEESERLQRAQEAESNQVAEKKRQQEEIARKKREKEVAERLKIEAEKKKELHEKKKQLQREREKKDREAEKKQREDVVNQQQHATAKITKKQTDVSVVQKRKSREAENHDEERQIEVEVIHRPAEIASMEMENNNGDGDTEENTSNQPQTEQAPTKPATEINFFSQYEATVNIRPDSPLISAFSEIERTFDLNTLDLSDEEQIDVNVTPNYVDNNNNTFVL